MSFRGYVRIEKDNYEYLFNCHNDENILNIVVDCSDEFKDEDTYGAFKFYRERYESYIKNYRKKLTVDELKIVKYIEELFDKKDMIIIEIL